MLKMKGRFLDVRFRLKVSPSEVEIFFRWPFAHVVFELREGAISPIPPPWPYLIVKNTLIWERLLCLAVSQCLRAETMCRTSFVQCKSGQIMMWFDVIRSHISVCDRFYFVSIPKATSSPLTRFQKKGKGLSSNQQSLVGYRTSACLCM